MKTVAAFLRGINVSGQKKIKMAELKLLLEQEGFTNVRTYIQSGNMVFDYHNDAIQKIGRQIIDLILREYGFMVSVVIMTPEKLKLIWDGNPFMDIEEKRQLYFALLNDPPEPSILEEFKKKGVHR